MEIASDYLGVVTDINQGSIGAYGAIIREIKNGSTSFNSCLFIHERRNYNFKAHSLAKHATSLGIGRHVWLGISYDPITVPVNILTTE